MRAATERGSFHGTLAIREFALDEQGAVTVGGSLSGRLADRRYPKVVGARVPSETVTLTLAPPSHGCGRLIVTFAHFDEHLEGLHGRFPTQTRTLAPAHGSRPRLHELFCRVDRRITPGQPAPAPDLIDMLNALVAKFR